MNFCEKSSGPLKSFICVALTSEKAHNALVIGRASRLAWEFGMIQLNEFRSPLLVIAVGNDQNQSEMSPQTDPPIESLPSISFVDNCIKTISRTHEGRGEEIENLLLVDEHLMHARPPISLIMVSFNG